ncbi:MAG: ParB/RepB/Spo0J family partition protein [Acidaminococcus sp.]|uniref:ParB/RepB/Spo0J family partition protein n=1 Tax=Acidaminococcus sp. TaxID=1872103 RepID=UPI003F13D36B
MAGKKGGLGLTGLDKMFGTRSKKAPAPVIEERKAEENVGEVAVKNLRPNPYQPRTVFDPDKLKELVESVKHSGVIQPLIVRKKGRQYEIVAGERRWRAAKEAGLSKVPVVVRNYDDATMMEVALVENMQRSDLDPLEEAKGIQNMMDALGLTQEEAARKLGKSRVAVTNALRLLKLPPEVQELVTAGKLTAGQARPLLGLPQAAQMVKVATQAVEGGWSARILEEVVKAVKEGKPYHIYMETEKNLIEPEKPSRKGKKKKAEAAAADVDVKAFQEQLIQYLGTRVKIQPDGKKGGRILIEYYGDEDLERLYELLKGPEPVSKRKAAGRFTV